MSVTLRGQRTELTGVPRDWRGPLPDLSIQRRLDKLDGYAEVPAELLHAGFADLGVLTWALLRLSFDDRSDASSYPEFAEALGLGHLTATAVQQRFQAALKPMLGTWIERHRGRDNISLYRAVVPKDTGKRYAMLRRSDLGLLQVPVRGKGARRVTVAHLADFARWQLECGRRGWTADALETIAARWQVSKATMRRSRSDLVDFGLLEVRARPGGRFSDLVWLKELYDPHWAVASAPVVNVSHPGETTGYSDKGNKVGVKKQRSTGSETRGSLGQEAEVDWVKIDRSTGSQTKGPIEDLSGTALTGDLPGLGGASATPLTSVPHDFGATEPQASPSQKIPLRSTTDTRRLASQLLADQPGLRSTEPRWRAGMLKILERACSQGLEPGHLARALQRVAEDQVLEEHCAVVRFAVKQAWADQRAGMCPQCVGEPGAHVVGCPVLAEQIDAQQTDPEQIRQLIVASLAEARTSRSDPDDHGSRGTPRGEATPDVRGRSSVGRAG